MDPIRFDPASGAYVMPAHLPSLLDVSFILGLALIVAYLAQLTFTLIVLAGRARRNLRGVRK